MATSADRGENLAARMGRWSAQHRKKAIWGWLGVRVPRVRDRRRGRDRDAGRRPGGVGESGRADRTIDDAFPKRRPRWCSSRAAPRRRTTPRFRAVVADVQRRLSQVPYTKSFESPYAPGNGGQISGRRPLRPDSLQDRRRRRARPRIASARRWMPSAAAQAANPDFTVERVRRRERREAAQRRDQRATSSRRSCTSLPITLLILLIAFGALVAAGVPLLLALTAVLATIGLMGLISHISARGQLDQRGDPADRPRGRRRLLDVLPAPRARGARVGTQRRGLAGGRGGDLGPRGAGLRPHGDDRDGGDVPGGSTDLPRRSPPARSSSSRSRWWGR